MRKNLTELVSNSDLIPGIYNYCDRWCERCQFRERCLVFATENEDTEHLSEGWDSKNRAFWNKLAQAFDEAQLMLAGLMPPTNRNSQSAKSEKTKIKNARQTRSVEKHQLTHAGRDYAAAATEWFSELAETMASREVGCGEVSTKESETFLEATEVIQWYQYQIAVKVLRALSSRAREGSCDEFASPDSELKDSDGSAKVALVGIDRSISAWRLIQIALPESSATVMPLLLQLHRLRSQVEAEFPLARDFVRPGFDEQHPTAEVINDE